MKKTKNNWDTKNLKGNWLVRAISAVLLLGLSYLFASLAIDSGSLAQYGLSILALYFGIANSFQAGRLAFSK
ncbi:hypothetical protein H0X09_03220 [Candidatus Saccharibacteria bacterium]|nr:hypothetical protein [Candidatus Saccharibacteria bacterium]